MATARPNIAMNITGTASHPSPEQVRTVGEQLGMLLTIGSESRADQATIQAAIGALVTLSHSQPGVQDTRITDTTITMGSD